MKLSSIFVAFLLSLSAQAQSMEEVIVREINTERAKLGLKPCRISAKHTEAAKLHAVWMRKAGKVGHQQTVAVVGQPLAPGFEDRGRLAGVSLFGEIINTIAGESRTSADSVRKGKEIYAGWYGSPEHNRIMFMSEPTSVPTREGRRDFQAVGLWIEWCPDWNSYVAVMVLGGFRP